MIYKGCERKIIMIKNPGNSYFDEVYFILKDKKHKNNYVNTNNMLEEANRIVNDNTISLSENEKKEMKRPKNKQSAITFCFGVISGIISAFAVFYIFWA